MTKEELEKRKQLCKNCYTCEKGVSPDTTIDDLKEGKVIEPISVPFLKNDEKKKRMELCKNCYTCEKGVSPDKTIDDMKEGQQIFSPSGSSSDRAKQCRVCYTCEKGVSKDITIDQMRGQSQDRGGMPFVYYIFNSGVSCNFRCAYPCYTGENKGRMSRSVIHKTLEWLFKKQPYKNITCHFFGGEPTLNWDGLVDIVEIGNEMAKSNGYTVTWSMTTNGSLLNAERLDWITKRFRPGNPFLLSLDGRPGTHNKYRVLVGGKPTYHLIPVDDIIKRFPSLEVRPTICADTAKDWFEDYRFLRNKGFKSIAIEPNYEMEWSEEQLRDYGNMLRQLGRYYIYAQKVGQPIRMKWVEVVIEGLQRGAAPTGQMCGVGFNCAAIDHRGKLYACQRYASYNEPEKFAIGDVEKGFDEFKLLECQSLLREEVQGDISAGHNCRTCGVSQFCFKGCNAGNAKLMGDRRLALPNYCVLTKIEVREALSVLMELNKLGLRKDNQFQGQGWACPK